MPNSEPLPIAQGPRRVELTRKRLWVLYLVAGLIKAQIEDLTGWTRREIDSGLDKWEMRAWSSESFWRTHRYLESAVARFLGLEVTTLSELEWSMELRRELQANVSEVLLRGPIDWDAVDALPWPEDLAADRA